MNDLFAPASPDGPRIRVGIGGWNYAPWRDNFYPAKLVQRRELEYASRQLRAIEINGTFYGAQKPATYAKWAAETPAGFIFSLKAPRYITEGKRLADAGKGVSGFVHGGLAEMGDRLGPILWQFMATKKFDADEFAAFLDLLPAKQDGLKLRHALEVRHDSFHDPRFFALAKAANAAIVLADSDTFPVIDEDTADFRYVRLQNSVEDCPTGYDAKALDQWAGRARKWATKGDAFVYFISGAKVRNPAAALALQQRLGIAPA